jgi:hypothetical protein
MKKFKVIFYIFQFLVLYFQCSNSYSQTLSNSGAVFNVLLGTVVTGDAINNTSGEISSAGTITITDFSNAGVVNGGGNYNISGNWINNATFVPSGGVVAFNSTVNQTIGGTNASTFYNLEINNSSLIGVTLSASASVEGVFTLTNGLVFTTATDLLTLNSGSSIGAVSNNSFVSGPVAKLGATDFIFPVGKDAKYRPIGISTLTGSETFIAEYFPVNPNTIPYNVTSKDATLDHISMCEYWMLNRTGTQSAFVTLSWDSYSCGVDVVADLAVAKWDGALWKDYGQGAFTGAADPVTGTITSNVAVTSFSPFTLASINSNNPLPIQLLNFTAKSSQEGNGLNVNLNWSTATEINNDYFNIERSVDAINFTSFARVNGAGTSKQILNYSTIDDAPLSGVSYYRLKQTDFDGNTSYSNIKAVNLVNNNDFIFKTYPNPNTGEGFYFQITTNSEELLVVISDCNGEEFYSNLISTIENTNDIYYVDAATKLHSGVYVIRVITNTNRYKQRFIVIN